jgi:hypothetical protein
MSALLGDALNGQPPFATCDAHRGDQGSKATSTDRHGDVGSAVVGNNSWLRMRDDIPVCRLVSHVGDAPTRRPTDRVGTGPYRG